MDSGSNSTNNGCPVAAMGVEDERGFASADVELAKEAALLFQARKYVECNKVLNQLLLKKPNDLKGGVEHA